MNFTKIITLLFFVLLSLNSLSQIRDTFNHSSDQNPNYQKSKDKYTKPKTVVIPTITTVTSQNVLNQKDSTIAQNEVPVEISSTKIRLESIQRKLKVAEKNNDQLVIAATLNDLGLYYVNANKLTVALDNYQKGLNINTILKNKIGILESLYAIGGIHTLQKNDVKAEEYYVHCLNLAKELHSSEKIKLASNALSKIYARKGNYKNAFEMQLLFKQITDSLNKIETENTFIKSKYTKQQVIDSIKQDENKKAYLKSISEKQLEVDSSNKISYLIFIGLILALIFAFMFYRSYRFTKQSNQIIALQKKEAEEKKIIIEKSLKEKEILLKEIHHRVKNNLQIISSLLNLQASRAEDEELKKTMTEAKNRIASMALIHQKIYQSDNLSSIDFQSYVEQMTSSIDSTFNVAGKKINYTINTNGIVLDIDTSIPLGLIINELLTNCYKYAFTDRSSGNITIVMNETKNNEIEFHIYDDGIGFQKELQLNSLKSLGLKLVKGLTEQIKGTLKIENNNGTHFFINFKKN